MWCGAQRSRNYVRLAEELPAENGPLYRLQKHYLLFVRRNSLSKPTFSVIVFVISTVRFVST